MKMNKLYTAVINITTAVESTTTEFVFSKHLISMTVTTDTSTSSTTSIISGTSPRIGNLGSGIVTESG